MRTTTAAVMFGCSLAWSTFAGAQQTAPSTPKPAAASWKATSNTSATPAAPAASATAAETRAETNLPLQPVTRASRAAIAKVTAGNGVLPNGDGQVWREYDISPYTLRVTSTNRPEQAIVDWILRETGYEAWHSEPVGLLSASNRTLRVYHTPHMQEVVAEVVDRFVNTEAETQAFGLQVVTVGSPNWRARAQRMLRPVTVQSQGIQAWLVAKEDAALLLAEISKRTDFRALSSPHLLVNNGQSTLISATRPRNYIRNVLLRADAWPGFEPEVGQVSEGFTLEFNPLLSIDGSSIDAVIKCNVDQVEKLVPVMLDVPTPVAPRQRTQMDVPQIASLRLHERFRWPAEQVLLISLGVAPAPVPAESGTFRLPLTNDPARGDLLLFVESKGKIAASEAPPAAAVQGPTVTTRPSYRSRY